MLEHILHIHDCIIHEGSDRYGHSSDAHRIYGQPEEFQCQYGHQQGQWYGDEGDYRGPDIHQEEEEYDYHEKATLEQGLSDIVDGAVDESLLAEDVRVYFNVGRDLAADFLHCLIQFGRELDGAGIRLLGHGHQHGRLSPVRGGSEFRSLVANPDFSYVREGYRGIALKPYHGLANGLHIRCGQDPADDVLVAVLVDDTAV